MRQLILTLFIVSLNIYAQHSYNLPEFDKRIKLGMSIDKFRNDEESKDFLEIEGLDELITLSAMREIADIKYEVYACFLHNDLIGLRFRADSIDNISDGRDGLEPYNYVLNRRPREYGDPDEVRYLWFDNKYRLEPDSLKFAISNNHLNVFSAWIYNDAKILIRTFGLDGFVCVDYIIALNIWYHLNPESDPEYFIKKADEYEDTCRVMLSEYQENLRMGISKEKALMVIPDYTAGLDEAGLEVIHFTEFTENNRPVQTWLTFDENKLVARKQMNEYKFAEEYECFNLRKAYDELSNDFILVFGQPYEETETWYNRKYKNKPSNYCNALIEGHTNKKTVWNLPDGKITQRMYGKDDFVVIDEVKLLNAYIKYHPEIFN